MKVRPKRLGDGMVVALLTLALLAPGLRAQSAQQPPARDRSAEPSEFASIRQWFGELDDTVLDVGGNIGTLALQAAARGAARVVTVEPASENYAILAHNVAANGATARWLLRR